MTQNLETQRNYAAWNTKTHTAHSFTSLSQKEKLMHICAVGHLAPSTHNTQPWRFRINLKYNSIDILLDRRAILPASDVVGRQACISIGAAIENMQTAAMYLAGGCTVSVMDVDTAAVHPLKETAQANDDALIHIATLTVQKESNTALDFSERYRALFRRKVLRAEYKRDTAIPEEVLAALDKAMSGLPVQFHTITDPARRQAIAEFQAQADGFVINNKKFGRELGDWLLPNDTRAGLGMPGVGFGLDDTQAKRMHRALSGEIPLQPDDGLKFSLAGKEYIEKTPFIGVLTTKNDRVADWVTAGQAFERSALILEAHGISHAVHAGIVEVTLINRMFTATLGTLRKMQVLFRAGYVKDPVDASRPHSPRQDLTNIVM